MNDFFGISYEDEDIESDSSFSHRSSQLESESNSKSSQMRDHSELVSTNRSTGQAKRRKIDKVSEAG